MYCYNLILKSNSEKQIHSIDLQITKASIFLRLRLLVVLVLKLDNQQSIPHPNKDLKLRLIH